MCSVYLPISYGHHDGLRGGGLAGPLLVAHGARLHGGGVHDVVAMPFADESRHLEAKYFSAKSHYYCT